MQPSQNIPTAENGAFMMPGPQLELRHFQPGDEVAFRTLNEEWIRTYFGMEKKDSETLGEPVRHFIDPGGYILMACLGGRAVGCCALMPLAPGSFEVAKMAVATDLRGQGIGRKLLLYVVSEAKQLGASYLYLETSHKLKNAIHLYEAVGFQHLPPERIKPSPYARADVYMEMSL